MISARIRVPTLPSSGEPNGVGGESDIEQTGARHSGEKPLRIFGLRPLNHILCGALFDDLSAFHHNNIVCQVRNHCKIVGDEQAADVQVVLQIPQQIKDLFLDQHVKR